MIIGRKLRECGICDAALCPSLEGETGPGGSMRHGRGMARGGREGSMKWDMWRFLWWWVRDRAENVFVDIGVVTRVSGEGGIKIDMVFAPA